jgi:hypothetical protein
MTGGADIPFSCRCGGLSGHLLNARPGEGTHLLCHCADCARAQALYDDASGPVAIFQTTPDRIKIETGKEHLALMQLSPNGLFRWTAACCDTQMFNTLKSPRIPFAGIVVARLADAAPLGPVLGEGFVPGPDGKTRHRHITRMIWRFLKRSAAARFSGRWRDTPFFDADGRPVAKPRLAPRVRRAGSVRP